MTATKTQRALIAAAVICIASGAIAAWMLRFDLQHTDSDGRRAYMLDRWSGQVYYIRDGESEPVAVR